MFNPKTKAIILASHPYSLRKLWGMTLVEKLIRQLSVSGVEECVVVFDQPREITSILRKDFSSWHKIKVSSVHREMVDAPALQEVGGDADALLVFEGNTILDARVMDLLIGRSMSGALVRVQSGEQSPLALTIGKDVLGRSSSSLEDLLGTAEIVRTAEMDSYIGSMRRRQEPFLYRIESDQDMAQAEKVAFSAIYKGATDFITKYVWPYPTRMMVHAISPSGITPNQITYVSMVLSFGAIPLFFLGHFWIAWIMGTIMSFLDTLDGKLARLTLRTSESGHWLDNASDTIYLWLWYAGIGWYFAPDLLDFQDINTIAAWSLVGFFTIDKIITGLFKKLFGAQLHDFGPIDWYARIYIARRNPFLVVLLIGLVMGTPLFGLHAMAIWQTATFAFHMMRFIYLPLSGQQHQVHTR